MDAATSENPAIQYHNIADQPMADVVEPPVLAFERQPRHCYGNSSPGEFPLASYPSVVLNVLASYNLEPEDLARLEATCTFFREAAHFLPDIGLSIPELAALDMCQKKELFKSMTEEQRLDLRIRCGGSWKLVLKFILAGEACQRWGKPQAIAGPGHSVVVTSKGNAYTFGCNSLGQLGHGSIQDECRPRLISSLQGIRIVQAAVGACRTMLVSDAGQVYTVGKDGFSHATYVFEAGKITTVPKLVESLRDIFVVQVAIGHYFTAVLSREGRVYTVSWGSNDKFCHRTDDKDFEPYPLLGPLENVPVVQISAGFCYLLALACAPNGMSVYSIGCGLGGKLGHGSTTNEAHPRVIEQFYRLNFQPVAVSAGTWHAAALGKDGRVCTWGWGYSGCLGHGNEETVLAPKVVEGLSNVKAVQVTAGDNTTFVISEDGNVYSFGCGESANLGHDTGVDEENELEDEPSPKLVTSLQQIKERFVQISLTNSIYWSGHTFAVAESGKLYSFGTGDRGQLGMPLSPEQMQRGNPELVRIDLLN